MKIGSLYKVQEKDLSRCASIFAEAFDEDPLMYYFLKSENYQVEQIENIYKTTLKSAIELGHVYAISEELEGVSVWFPESNLKVPVFTFIKNGGLSLIWKNRPGILHTLLNYENYAVHLKKKHLDRPHWYLFAIAIQKKHQKKGYSKSLIEPFIDYTDVNEFPCYLETHNTSNIAYYKRFGFELVETGKLPGSNIKHHAMVRKPVHH